LASFGTVRFFSSANSSMATSVSSSVQRGRPLLSLSSNERVSSHRASHSETVFSLQRSSCAMSRPVQPTPCSVTMAARSTSVSWSMQPEGRPNREGGEEEEGEGEAIAAEQEGPSRCCCWYFRAQSSHRCVRSLRGFVHALQSRHCSCTNAKECKAGHAQTACSERAGSGQHCTAGQSGAFLTLCTPAWCERMGVDCMLTLFLLLSCTQHNSDSMQRRSDSSGVCSTRARVRLHGSTVARLSLVSLQVWKGRVPEGD
jgi:hypothetical protein